MVVVKKMGKGKIFAVAKAASECCDVVSRLHGESAKTPELLAARDSAITAYAECLERLNGIVEAGRSDEKRYKDDLAAYHNALTEREKAKAKWDSVRSNQRRGYIHLGEKPIKPDSIVVPPKPEPMADSVRVKYEGALDEIVRLAIALDDADVALRDNVCEVEKLKRKCSSAFECLSECRKAYEHARNEEIVTTRLAREEEEEIRKAEIAEAQARKAEAEVVLAARGAL